MMTPDDRAQRQSVALRERLSNVDVPNGATMVRRLQRREVASRIVPGAAVVFAALVVTSIVSGRATRPTHVSTVQPAGSSPRTGPAGHAVGAASSDSKHGSGAGPTAAGQDSPQSTSGSGDHHEATRSAVAGGWEGTPPSLLTSFDPSKRNAKIIGHAIWTGSWTGVSIFTANDVHLDYATGNYSFHAVDVFTGVWLGDHSRGTLTWHETAHGNFITGATFANVDIVNGDGDPSFQCSSGHFVWDGYALIPASFGGYNGTWTHGCSTANR